CRAHQLLFFAIPRRNQCPTPRRRYRDRRRRARRRLERALVPPALTLGLDFSSFFVAALSDETDLARGLLLPRVLSFARPGLLGLRLILRGFRERFLARDGRAVWR